MWDRLELNMLYTGKHKQYNVFEVSPEALRQQGFESPCLSSGDTFFMLSGSNLFIPHIEKVQSNLKSCSDGDQQGLSMTDSSRSVAYVKCTRKVDAHAGNRLSFPPLPPSKDNACLGEVQVQASNLAYQSITSTGRMGRLSIYHAARL